MVFFVRARRSKFSAYSHQKWQIFLYTRLLFSCVSHMLKRTKSSKYFLNYTMMQTSFNAARNHQLQHITTIGQLFSTTGCLPQLCTHWTVITRDDSYTNIYMMFVDVGLYIMVYISTTRSLKLLILISTNCYKLSMSR